MSSTSKMAENATEESDKDTLAELNKDFKRSKVMQILRFLHDQDMLNKRFNAIDMDSDIDTDGTTSDSDCTLTPQQRLNRLRDSNVLVDSEGSESSVPSFTRNRRLRTATVDARLELDSEEGAWAVSSPTSPMPPTEPCKTKLRFRSKTDGEKTRRVLTKLNVRPASAIGNGLSKNTQRYKCAEQLNKEQTTSNLNGDQLRYPGTEILWDPTYVESSYDSNRVSMISSRIRKSGPSSLSTSHNTNIVPVRSSQLVADSLLRGGGAINGLTGHTYASKFRGLRDRQLRIATEQFDIREIGSIRDASDLKAIRKCSKQDKSDQVTTIAMVKLPPLTSLEKHKLVTGSNLVNTC